MNVTIFSERLRICRKRKFSSQQAFADAYMERFGTIRDTKKRSIDHNMFGTIQSWEQGKSMPTADVLANICDLLDCDSDYLLGRIDERNHDINDMRRYTGLSEEAIEQLHRYCLELTKMQPWTEDEGLLYYDHVYYHSFALFLIDEILCGSKNYKLSGVPLCQIFEKMKEWGLTPPEEKYEFDEEYPKEEYEKSVQEERQWLDTEIYLMTNNIRDILIENCQHNIFPPSLGIVISSGYSFCASVMEGSKPVDYIDEDE